MLRIAKSFNQSFNMLLGNVHEVVVKLELELKRSTRDCNWQSVKYLEGCAYVRNDSPSLNLTILCKKQMYLTIG